jgi:hypothetical protein
MFTKRFQPYPFAMASRWNMISECRCWASIGSRA